MGWLMLIGQKCCGQCKASEQCPAAQSRDQHFPEACLATGDATARGSNTSWSLVCRQPWRNDRWLARMIWMWWNMLYRVGVRIWVPVIWYEYMGSSCQIYVKIQVFFKCTTGDVQDCFLSRAYAHWRSGGSNPKGSRSTLFASFCRILLNYINWRSESYQHQLGEKNTWPLSHQDWPPSSYSWANAVSTTSTGQGAPDSFGFSESKLSKLSRRLRTVGCFGMV